MSHLCYLKQHSISNSREPSFLPELGTHDKVNYHCFEKLAIKFPKQGKVGLTNQSLKFASMASLGLCPSLQRPGRSFARSGSKLEVHTHAPTIISIIFIHIAN